MSECVTIWVCSVACVYLCEFVVLCVCLGSLELDGGWTLKALEEVCAMVGEMIYIDRQNWVGLGGSNVGIGCA